LNNKLLENETDKNFVYFSNQDYFNRVFGNFNKKLEPKREQKVCAVTGKPAKYFDPLTKQYYSTIESFKMLREKYFQKEEDGLLFRIQTLSDFASQKKERLKKLLLSVDNTNATKEMMNMVTKYGILKNEGIPDFDKRSSHRNIYYL
jgi:hypothetical protein